MASKPFRPPMKVVAERVLRRVRPKGSRVTVRLLLGHPYPHPEGDWACPVSAEGLRIFKGRQDFAGVDSWQALMLAQRFLRTILEYEMERGAVFLWHNEPVALDCLFCQQPIE